MGKIKISNLKFSYNDKLVFNGLNFTLRKGKSLSIIGGCACGKTTLLRLLDGQLEYDGEIYINGVMVFPSGDLFKELSVVFRNFTFEKETVKEEINYYAMMYGVDYTLFVSKVNEFFGINKSLKKKIDDLSFEYKVLLKLICTSIGNPSFLCIDDLLCYLSLRNKILFINYLEERDITLINVTTDMEEVLYTDYILCLYDGISAIDGKTLDVLGNDQLLRRLGLDLPFMVDLSIQLKLYGLVDKIYLSNELMVNKLWK